MEELNHRGGSGFVYLLDAEKLEPGFKLETDMDALMVRPGETNEIKIKVVRRDFAGPIQLQVEGLGAEFAAESLSMGEKSNEASIRIRCLQGSKPGQFSMIKIHGLDAGMKRIPCFTRSALTQRWPKMREVPGFLNGLICVSVKQP